MYRNVFGKRISRAGWKEMLNAQKNRQEIIKAGLSRRELFRMGLLTSAGYLVAKDGLSAWADDGCQPGQCQLGCSPPTQAFTEPLPIMPVLPKAPAIELAPDGSPNTAINPATGLAFEGRTESFQYYQRFPPQEYFVTRMRKALVTMSPDLPLQPIWGFNLGGTDPAISPGPTIVTQYGKAVLIRRFNELPPEGQNDGFGLPSVSTHVHNFHTSGESDGGPCRFFERGQFYDYHHTMALAGFASDHQPNGDINESLSTLWYHDHRIDNTAPNVYKGLAGFFLTFNQFDTGDETTGFHLPTFPDFDIPLMLTDKLFDPGTGLLCFDLFGLDGLIGDKFLVNGKIQPFFEVKPRRYRFRVLDGGPSRFYELFLTNPNDPNQTIPFWVIANDGNLLPKPVQMTSFRIGVAERMDIIIDFAKTQEQFGTSIVRFENRLEQTNGRGPTGDILPAGQGDSVLEFRILSGPVTDNSVDPATGPSFYQLPSTTATDPSIVPRVTRTFRFDRNNGMWAINSQIADCTATRFTVQRNTVEKWILQNNSGGWQHPIHIHMEEFQILSRNGQPPSPVERSRKDVVQLRHNEQIELFFRFRDFLGGAKGWPLHCHNTVHEDHAMLLIWTADDVGDTNSAP